MRHALVILCHRDISQLEKLVEFFDDDFIFYVHIDKKSDILKEEVEAFVQSHPNVHVYRKYKVNWGGIDILRVVLYLMRLVLKYEKIDYIHTCSAQDYSIKKLQELKDFYKNQNGKQFIEYHQLPYSRWNQGTFERLEGYQLYDLFDFSTEKGRRIIRKVNDWQKKTGNQTRDSRFLPASIRRVYLDVHYEGMRFSCDSWKPYSKAVTAKAEIYVWLRRDFLPDSHHELSIQGNGCQ